MFLRLGAIQFVVCFTLLQSTFAFEFCAKKLAEARAQFASMDLRSGVGNLGFLSPTPALTPEARIAALAMGINYLRARFTIMPDLETALIHDNAIADPGVKHFYIIGSAEAANQIATLQQPALATAIDNLMVGGVYYTDGGKWLRFPDDIVRERFTAAKMSWVDFGVGFGPGLQLPGWLFSQNYHGVLRSTDIKHTGGVRRLLKAGYRVTFNTDFEAVLLGNKNKARKGGAASRITPEYMAVMRSLFQNGYAYTVEAWDPDGKLVGGDLGFCFGGVFKADTIYWDDPKLNGQDSVIGTMMAEALTDRLASFGVNFMLVGSNLPKSSRAYGATYISGEEVRTEVARLSQMPRLPLADSWQWKEAALAARAIETDRINEQRQAEVAARKDERRKQLQTAIDAKARADADKP